MACDATLNRYPAVGTLDAGASHCFMSEKDARLCGLEINTIKAMTVELGQKSTILCNADTSGRISINGI